MMSSGFLVGQMADCFYRCKNAGQLLTETFPVAGVTITNTYDAKLRRSSLSVSSAGVSPVAYSYDATSRLSTVGQASLLVSYSYLANSSLVSNIVFANGGTSVMTTTKTYDTLNRLLAINSQPSAADAISFAYDYNSANQRAKRTDEDGSYWDYTYDSLGQVTGAHRKWADTTSVAGQQYDYNFDDIGNRKTTIINSHTGTYTANSLNQYTQRTVPGVVDVLGTANSNATVTVNNQPTSRHGEYFHGQLTVSNAASAAYTNVSVVGVRKNAGTNQQDVVTEVTGHEFVVKTPEQFSYDADGNTLSDGRWTNMSWDAENRLIRLETAAAAVAGGAPKQKLEFSYDPFTRRSKKKVYSWVAGDWLLNSEIRYAYDGWNLIAELNGSNAVVRSYVWGLDLSGTMQGAGGVGGMLVANAGGSSNFAAYDGSGNVAALVNVASSGLAGLYEYAPFGETLQLTGTMAGACPIRFSTKYQDTETGWLNYTFRLYEPGTGRWRNRDPIEEFGGFNIYAFALNAPTVRIDTDGRMVLESVGVAASTSTGIGSTLGTSSSAITYTFTTTGGASTVGGATLAGGALGTGIVLYSGYAGWQIGTAIDRAAGGMYSDWYAGTFGYATDWWYESDGSSSGSGRVDNCKDPCKGLRDQLNKHLRKLEQYRNNPDSMDNRGFLKNNPDKRQQIIDGRIRNLERQIENFRKQLEECEKKHGLK